MFEDRIFRLNEVVKIFGCKPHTIIHLIELGLIVPFENVKGRGKSRGYSFKNIVEIGIFLSLNKLSIAYERIRQILRSFDEFDIHYENFTFLSVVGMFDPGPEFVSLDINMLSKEGKEATPQEFLKRSINQRKKDRDVTDDDFALYVILELRNLIRHIITKIERL